MVDNTDGDGCRLSLRVVLIVAASMIAVVSATVSLVPLYERSLSSSMQAAQQYSDEISEQIGAKVSNFLTIPVSLCESFQRAILMSAFTTRDWQKISEWTSVLANKHNDVLVIYYLDDATGFLVGHNVNTLNISVPPKQNYSILSFYSAANHSAQFRYVPDSNVSAWNYYSSPFVQQTTTFNHTTRPYYATLHAATNDNLVWVSSFVDYSKLFADVGLGGSIIDPVTQQKIGIFGVFYRTSAILEYFSQLSVGQTGFAFLIDVTVNAYLGGTSKASTIMKSASGAVSLLDPLTVDDEQVRHVVASLGSSLYSCADQCFQQYGSGTGTIFISVKTVTDEYGLNLRIVVAVPAMDYLSPIVQSMKISVIAAAASVFGLLVVSALSMHVLLLPLKLLEMRIIGSATLRDHNMRAGDYLTAEGRSFLIEIANIESAYAQLILELRKVRSFLPQAVLRQMMADANSASSDERHNRNNSQNENDDAEFDEFEVPHQVIADSHAPAPPAQLHDMAEPKASSASGAPGEESRKSSTAHSAKLSYARNNPLDFVVGPAPSGRPTLSITPMRRHVTMVMGNLKSFHHAATTLSVDQLTAMHSTVTSRILAIVNSNNGVLDSLHGDRFVITFNASIPCQKWAQSACETVVAAMQINGVGLGYTGIRFGIATDTALCGAFGSDLMRRYSIVGPVVNQAFSLMQFCKVENVSNLMNSKTFGLVRKQFAVHHVNYVLLHSDEKGSLISTVTNRAEPSSPGASDECSEFADRSVVHNINAAFEAFVEGDMTKAKVIIASLPPQKTVRIQRCLKAAAEVRASILVAPHL